MPDTILSAVDLGSNSFRLEQGVIDLAGYKRLTSEKFTIRLAAGLNHEGFLTQEAQQRALAALSSFKQHYLASVPSHHVRVVATQAIRSAKNAQDFIQKAEEILGVGVDLLSGQEEARLVYRGSIESLPPSNERRLVVDIGGGSTELALGQGRHVNVCESFHVGCVNTSIRYFQNGLLSPTAFQRAITACASEFVEAIEQFGPCCYDEVYGTAGTFGAAFEIVEKQGWDVSKGLTLEHLYAIKCELEKMQCIEKVQFVGLQDDRREVIAGGVAVLIALYETLKMTSMRLASGALRLGVLYDLNDRLHGKDVRDESVTELCHQVDLDLHQAHRVLSIAQQMGRHLACCDHAMSLYLKWAALLHEVGSKMTTSRYHQHGCYILQHSDLPGFSEKDKYWVSQLILAQRGNLKKVLSLLDNERYRQAVLALRLAVLLTKSRRHSEVPVDSIVREPLGKVCVQLSNEWLLQHPQEHHLLLEECQYWAETSYPLEIKGC